MCTITVVARFRDKGVEIPLCVNLMSEVNKVNNILIIFLLSASASCMTMFLAC